MSVMWSVPREWDGETVFIVAGGPSVTVDDVNRLKGRRLIVVNSSYEKAPCADYLFFGDSRWWRLHGASLKSFAGQIVTVSRSAAGDRLLRLVKVDPSQGLSSDQRRVSMRKTSLQGAINFAVHLGVARVVLLGADMQSGPDGRTHHHEPHPWPQKAGCWDEQMAELRLTVEPLRALGIEVINTSPVSRIDWWPKAPLEACL